MATVQPFKGVVFDPTRVSDLSQVTCPPYDVISPEERTVLYDRHPYNVVRIVSGREEPQDDEHENKYTRAASFFRSWLWEGELHQDERPALYVYRQAFTDPSGSFRRVWGIVGTISLDDEILAHEATMAGPKADRLALMTAVPANLSPIYALYREPDGSSTVSSQLREAAGESPVADFVDDEQTRHTVWATHDKAFHEHVATALAGSPLLIADGHHRFETAKRYREMRGRGGPWDHVMCLLVDAGAEPVCILPYHRVVLDCRVSDPVSVLAEGFEVTPIGPADPAEAAKLGLELWNTDRPGTFVAFVDQDAYRITAKQIAPSEIPAGILKRAALEPLGVRFAEESLAFTPHAEEVAGRVVSGRARCGFLIQPVSVQHVWDLAASGAKMPEKSTYFHPKPRDGIVMRSLE